MGIDERIDLERSKTGWKEMVNWKKDKAGKGEKKESREENKRDITNESIFTSTNQYPSFFNSLNLKNIEISKSS